MNTLKRLPMIVLVLLTVFILFEERGFSEEDESDVYKCSFVHYYTDIHNEARQITIFRDEEVSVNGDILVDENWAGLTLDISSSIKRPEGTPLIRFRIKNDDEITVLLIFTDVGTETVGVDARGVGNLECELL